MTVLNIFHKKQRD